MQSCFFTGVFVCKILIDHLGLSVLLSNSATEPDVRFGYKKLTLNIMHLRSLRKEEVEQTYYNCAIKLLRFSVKLVLCTFTNNLKLQYH